MCRHAVASCSSKEGLGSLGKGICEENRNGSFSSAGEPGLETRAGSSGCTKKERWWVYHSGKEPVHPPPEAKAHRANVEGNLRSAHFTIQRG